MKRPGWPQLPRRQGPGFMQLWRARHISVIRIADRERKAAARATRKARVPLRWNRDAIVAAIPVAAVAAIAGVVSYSHIVALGMRTHQGPADSHLLPIPIDGLILAGSVILAAGSPLGWLGIALGVGGTLFANLEFGIGYGPLSAAVSTWPAVAFTVATFMLERWLKSQRGQGGQGGQNPGDDETGDGAMPLPAGQCPHGVANSVSEAAVFAYLHERDCLNDEPSQRNLAARFGLHRTKVAELVGHLNGNHPPKANSQPLAPAP